MSVLSSRITGNWVFVQQFHEINNKKKNIKALYFWPVVREIHQSPVVSPKKSQLCETHVHTMTSLSHATIPWSMLRQHMSYMNVIWQTDAGNFDIAENGEDDFALVMKWRNKEMAKSGCSINHLIKTCIPWCRFRCLYWQWLATQSPSYDALYIGTLLGHWPKLIWL